jgi:hypothetical protein
MSVTRTRQTVFIGILVLLSWTVFCNINRAESATGGPLDVPAATLQANLKISQDLFDFVEKRSNPKTGLSLSFFGDNRPIARYGSQIYDVGLRLLADGPLSKKIIKTLVKNNPSHATRDSPQTMEQGHNVNEGIFSWIRIEGFDQPEWWNFWEWSIKTGENAWLGKGALHYYRQTRDRRGLQIARERAEFILGLQDQDGGVRVGPEQPKNTLWWRVKSTENNESALNFLDEIYLTTHDPRYKNAADRIYQWLMTTMHNRNKHLFIQGLVYQGGKWVASPSRNLATDTS